MAERLRYGDKRRGLLHCSCRLSGICVAFFLMVVGSVAMAITGTWLYVWASQQQREHLVQKYDEAIKRWTQGERARFGALSVSAFCQNASDGVLLSNGSARLLPESPPDTLHDTEVRLGTETLPQYESLVLRTTGMALGLGALHVDLHSFTSRSGVGSWQEISSTSAVFGISVDGGLEPSNLVLDAVPLLRLRHRTHGEVYPSRKSCASYGAYHIGKCWVLSYLKRICVQVAPNASRWRLHPRELARNESYGCNFARRRWEPFVYEDVPMAKGLIEAILNKHSRQGSGNSVNEYILDRELTKIVAEGLTVEVRSSVDPYLYALEITDGALDFGLSASDERESGILCFIFSGLLLLPVICACVLRRCAESCEGKEAFDADKSVPGGRGIGRTYVDFSDNEI